MSTHPRHAEPLPLGGDGAPYSKGLMARALTAVGMPTMRAHELARRIEEDLAGRGESAATLDRIEELADDDVTMKRLRRFLALRELDVPVIVLLGGATGTGKSTVATELAYRLGITRVTSTDFIRQTMRAFFSRDFMPSIHYSSFEAGEGLREPEVADEPAIAGFLEQSRNVLVGVHASIDRALEEGWSMVLEGVHLVPGMLPPIENALVVQTVIAIQNEEAHASHFWIRDMASDGMRSLDKYLQHMSDIRYIQDYIVDRARGHGVPVIDNRQREKSIAAVMELVLTAADRLQKVS